MDKVTRQFRLQQWAEALRDHKKALSRLWDGAGSITFQSISITTGSRK